MRILSVGGGSGGHITPIVAVNSQLRLRIPDAELRVWCDKKYSIQLQDMLAGSSTRVDTVVSGKLRRYANLTFWQHIKYHIFKTHLRNIADAFKITFGFLQSIFKLIAWRPDVVFCKGGYVCLPVGVAAHTLGIPLVIHDSDTVPGLTNRVLARFAAQIGTGAPVDNYPNYPKSKTHYIGIPVRKEIKKFTSSESRQAKIDLGLDPNRKLVFAYGGGGGAAKLNRAIAELAPRVLKEGWQILLLTGKGKSGVVEMQSGADGFKVVDFISDGMFKAIGTADIAVTRAGATAIAEFATVGAATIIVPSPHLAGDHQTKNAKVYSASDAAIVIDERDADKNPDLLSDAILNLMGDDALRDRLGKNLSKFAKPDALEAMVNMILELKK